jgi:hypothetical protein
MTTLHTNRRSTYFEQARTWYRYAKYLKGRPYDAYLKKEEALAHSFRLRGRSFVLPATLHLAADSESGLHRLKRWNAVGSYRFLELTARVVQVDDDDPASDEVHLLLEEPERTSSRNRRYLVGRLPQEDAFWLSPLLRLETDAYGTGPIFRVFVEGSVIASGTRGRISAEASEVRVVIAHAHEAARQWFDWKDERRQRFEELYRSTYYDDRSYHAPSYDDESYIDCAYEGAET